MNPAGIIVLVLIVVVLILAIFTNKRSKKFKSDKIYPLIREVFPNCEYSPDKGITREQYKHIGCMKNGQTFKSHDLLEGKTQTGVPFSFSEVLVTTTHYNGKSTTTRTDFKGAIFSFKYNKTFEHKTYLCANTLHTKFYFKKPHFQNLKKMETEDVKFNKNFTIYSDNTADSFYLLKPNVMERIVELKNKYKTIMVVFREGWIYIIVPSLSLFKAPPLGIYTENLVSKYLNKSKEDMKYFIDLIDTFDIK